MQKPDPSIHDQVDPGVEDQALREAEADVRAGRVIPHEIMRRWLLSWGTKDELPPPQCDR